MGGRLEGKAPSCRLNEQTGERERAPAREPFIRSWSGLVELLAIIGGALLVKAVMIWAVHGY